MKNAFIYLLDHINTLFVDECKNCSIVAGPVQTSMFVRNCTNCRILASCQQYRVRDCNVVTTFLACTSDPIIESSSELKFAPYQFSYPELKDASSSAASRALTNIKMSFDETCSIVPKTVGSLEHAPVEDATPVLIAVFHHPEAEDNTMTLIRQIVDTGKAFLVQTRTAVLRPEDIRQILGGSVHASHAKLGPIIALLFCGAKGEVNELCTDIVKEVVRTRSIQPQTLLHVTDNPATVNRQFQMFARLCDAQQNRT
nr:unnamed protein product [Spirometra erinaceieuropaei]